MTEEKLSGLKWAMGTALLLAVMKGGAAVLCQSRALMASALDSLMDLGMSSVNFLSVKKAAKPPDWDHPYGHEKIESLAAYSQGLVILLLALFFMGETLSQRTAAFGIVRPGLALAVILAATLINGGLIWKLKRAQQRTGSLIMQTESTHYLIDLLSYVVVMISLLLAGWTRWPFFDVIGGLLVAAYVAFLSFQILYRAANELVDRTLPRGVLDKLDRIVRGHHRSIVNYHELRTRRVGHKSFIDFHLEFRGIKNFEEAHAITESLIEKIKEELPNSDVTIHEDPEGAV